MKHTYKYNIFLFVIFLLSCTNVYASCTDSELSKFKKVQDDYTVTYEIDKETKTYNLYFKAPMPDNFYYEIYTEQKLECAAVDNYTMKCTNFPQGNYRILVVGTTNECNDVLKNITVKLPKYNTLADDPLCEGIEEYVLCSPTYDKEITYEEFASRTNTYRKNNTNKKEELNTPNQEQIDKQKEKQNEFITKVLNYIKEYLIEIIIVTIFVILSIITIIITIKSIRKSRRLE